MMPSSTWVHTSTVCDLVWKYQPKTVLDIGPGFGRWGFTCREFLDVFKGRIDKKDWQTRITGIEIFPKYISPLHQYIYDEIIVDDALRYLQTHDRKFDLIICGDVLEHFDKAEGRKLLDLIFAKAVKAGIVCVPLGNGYPQGEVCGNKFEAHLSIWEPADFKADPRVTRLHVVAERIKQRPYGIVLMEK